MGRPSKYKKEFCEQIIKYFAIEPYRIEKLNQTSKDGSTKEKYIEIPRDLPLLSKFAADIGVTRETLYDWATSRNDEGELRYPEFSHAYKKAKEYQRYILITNGLRGNYNNAFAWGTAKNLIGFRDKQEIEETRKNFNFNFDDEQVLDDKLKEMVDEYMKGEKNE